MIEKLKFGISIIIFICMFLPLGSCGREVTSEPSVENKKLGKINTKSTNPSLDISSIEYFTPINEIINEIKINDPTSWLLLAIFIWPLVIILSKKYFLKTKWKLLIYSFFELLFSAFSIYCIHKILYDFWYKPTIWGHLVFTLFITYLLILIYEMANKYRMARFRRI